jgi:hypothetical protein
MTYFASTDGTSISVTMSSQELKRTITMELSNKAIFLILFMVLKFTGV